MPNVSEEDFIQSLSKIEFKGTRHSWNWLINNKNSAEFIEWFCQNVTSANYLSSEEANEYNELLSSGKVLEGDELDEEISNLLPDLSELSELNDDYFAELSHQLEDVQKYSESLESWVDSQRNEIKAVKEEANQLKKKNDNLQVKLVNAQKECFGKNSTLESSIHQLIKNLKNQKEHSLKNLNDGLIPRFLADLPIQRYVEESAMFSCQLNSYMDELFSMGTKQLSYGQTAGGHLSFQLNKLKSGLLNSQVLRFEAEAERRGLEHACENIRAILQTRSLCRLVSNPSMVMDKLMLLKQTFQSRKEDLGDVALDSHEVKFQMPSNLWLNKLTKVVKANVQEQCIQVERLQQELVLLEKRSFCANLKSVADVLKDHTATDLIWVFLLGGEVTEILNLFKLANSAEEFIIDDQRERFQRMDVMKRLKERREYEIVRTETWPLINYLLSYFKIFSKRQESSFPKYCSKETVSSSCEDPFSALKILVKHSENCESEKIMLENLLKDKAESVVPSIKTRSKEVVVFNDAVFCNSTRTHVVLCPSKQLMFRHHYDPIIKELKSRLVVLKTGYQNEKQRSSAQKNALRTLWITFLFNPEKMITIIDQLNQQ